MPIDAEAALRAKRFEATALPYMDSIYRSACRMMGNESDAQDLAQDTYLRAYRFFDTFREGTNCRAWLFAILKNTFINTIDRNRRRPQTVPLSKMVEHGMELQLSTDPEDEIPGHLFSDDVFGALDELPIAYRTVVLLACVDKLSYREIANTIGCPIGTVMSRLYRGRKLLRERLASFVQRRVKL
jgi:RNA polymerase sigma-70 factor (ECF subfamily)